MVCITLGGGVSLCVDRKDHLVLRKWSGGVETKVADLGLATEHRFKMIESCVHTLSIHAVREE